MISKKEVQYIAKLARLGLSTREEGKFQKELSSILDYIEQLKKVDVARTEGTSHPLKVQNVLREDEAKKTDGAEIRELAPENKEGYIKVKPILK